MKRWGGEKGRAGKIWGSQLGRRINPGNNVGMGRDCTLFAIVEGIFAYERMARSGKKVSVYAE